MTVEQMVELRARAEREGRPVAEVFKQMFPPPSAEERRRAVEEARRIQAMTPGTLDTDSTDIIRAFRDGRDPDR